MKEIFERPFVGNSTLKNGDRRKLQRLIVKTNRINQCLQITLLDQNDQYKMNVFTKFGNILINKKVKIVV